MKLAAVALSLCIVSQAQVAQPATPAMNAPQPAQVTTQSGAVYSQLEQTAQTATVNLARLRIDKWKTEGEVKRQAQANSESLQRNMQSALPAIIAQARQNPNSLSAVFKLYRNVNALYDVFASVTESAGAFGDKKEFQALANDAQNFDAIRRALGDEIETLAARTDSQIAQLQSQMAQARAQAAAMPPKKVVVDDNEPVKKPRKKKPAAKAAPAAPPSQ